MKKENKNIKVDTEAGKTPAPVLPDGHNEQTSLLPNENNSPEVKTQEIEYINTPVFDICRDVVIVVCGTTATLPLLLKAWTGKAPGATIIGRNIEAKNIHAIFVSLLADDQIPATFILVPANCFPTHVLGIADLLAYRVRTTNDGTILHDTRLPIKIETDALLSTYSRLKEVSDTATDEEIIREYNAVANAEKLPEHVANFFGNTVGYVTNAAPNITKVAEALLSRKFICTNTEGFAAIKDLLTKFYD